MMGLLRAREHFLVVRSLSVLRLYPSMPIRHTLSHPSHVPYPLWAPPTLSRAMQSLLPFTTPTLTLRKQSLVPSGHGFIRQRWKDLFRHVLRKPLPRRPIPDPEMIDRLLEIENVLVWVEEDLYDLPAEETERGQGRDGRGGEIDIFVFVYVSSSGWVIVGGGLVRIHLIVVSPSMV